MKVDFLLKRSKIKAYNVFLGNHYIFTMVQARLVMQLLDLFANKFEGKDDIVGMNGSSAQVNISLVGKVCGLSDLDS